MTNAYSHVRFENTPHLRQSMILSTGKETSVTFPKASSESSFTLSVTYRHRGVRYSRAEQISLTTKMSAEESEEQDRYKGLWVTGWFTLKTPKFLQDLT